MGLLDWIFKPLDEIENTKTIVLKEEEKTKVSLEALKTEQNKMFKPLTFESYIGQKKAKLVLNKYINAISKRNLVFPHTLIYGTPGTGKTTLANILASNLNVHMTSIITSTISGFEEIKNLLLECNGGILFFDEIHGLQREEAEKLYTIMQDFQYEGYSIKPFTLIGATTEIGEVVKNMKPFYDRFKIILELEKYTIKDLTTMCEFYKKKLFDDEKFNEENYELIAKNCRNTPRILIKLLETTIYFDNDIKSVFNSLNIIENGVTEKDLKVLSYIFKSNSTGLQSIASYLGENQYNYLYNIEPYLLSNEYLIRTSKGRKTTEKGIKLLNKYKLI